jgi:hypothetical protein
MPGIRSTKRPPDDPEHHSNLRYNRCYAATFVRLYARRDAPVQTRLRVPRDSGPGGRGYSKICSDVGNLARHGRPERPWQLPRTRLVNPRAPGEAGQLPLI